VAIVVTTGIAMVLVVSGDLGELADTTVLLLLLVFSAINVAVLVLRRDRVAHRHFRAPTAIPVIGAVVSLALLTTKDASTFARSGILLLAGSVLWAVNWRLHGRHVSALDTGQIKAVEARNRKP
jgi:amino acid transporter